MESKPRECFLLVIPTVAYISTFYLTCSPGTLPDLLSDIYTTYIFYHILAFYFFRYLAYSIWHSI